MTHGQKMAPKNGVASDEWFTPSFILEPLLPFDVDVCTSPTRRFDIATTNFTQADDGLNQDWRGFAWMNPPYSDIKTWMKRFAEHGDGIALTYFRPETNWWYETCWSVASAIIILRRRVRFIDEQGVVSGGGLNASTLVAYGPRGRERLVDSGLAGVLLTDWRATG